MRTADRCLLVKRKHEIHLVCGNFQPGVQPLGKFSLKFKCIPVCFYVVRFMPSAVAMLCLLCLCPLHVRDAMLR